MESDKNGRFIDDHFSGLLDSLELVRDVGAIKIALQQFTKQSGFEHFAYAHMRGTDSWIVSNYPEEWQQRYLANNYFASDPVITNAKRMMRPFNWSGRDMHRHGAEISRFANEAGEFGIRSGFAVPIRVGFGGTALLTFASSRRELDPVGIRDLAQAATATAFAHINLVRLSATALRAAEIALSPREATCLKWASFGKTKAETARMTGLSEKTVRFYLDQAMGKLGARNVSQAVGIAVEKGVI